MKRFQPQNNSFTNNSKLLGLNNDNALNKKVKDGKK